MVIDIGVVLRRRSGVAKERVSGYFGSGSDEMVMTDVYCGGSERHLTLCRHTSGPGVYCPHFASAAGVTCNFVGKSFEFMSNRRSIRTPIFTSLHFLHRQFFTELVLSFIPIFFRTSYSSENVILCLEQTCE